MVTEERVPKRLRVAGNSRDVFALVKMNMSDSHLSQDPLLVYPAGLEPSTTHFWRNISQSAKVLHAELDDDRKGELSKLAAAFKNDFPHLQRAVNYYGGLMDDNRPRQPPPVLRFVEAGPHAGSRVGVVELGQRPPPPKPFHLKVKFHKGWPSLHLPSGGKSAKPLCYDVQCVCCILNFGFQHLTSAFLESSGSTIGCRAALTAAMDFGPSSPLWQLSTFFDTVLALFNYCHTKSIAHSCPGLSSPGSPATPR